MKNKKQKRFSFKKERTKKLNQVVAQKSTVRALPSLPSLPRPDNNSRAILLFSGGDDRSLVSTLQVAKATEAAAVKHSPLARYVSFKGVSSRGGGGAYKCFFVGGISLHSPLARYASVKGVCFSTGMGEGG